MGDYHGHKLYESNSARTSAEALEARYDAEVLAFHQLQLFASTLRREIRNAAKAKHPSKHAARIGTMIYATQHAIRKVRSI
jgi:hypothetical protein